ncbi:MAG TPA: zinc ribbon domain-containing protein, partial [Thermoplasmata archaeon]|nr:zinc ribbon domain-containing protein [Thermoplasmata archaeon]
MAAPNVCPKCGFTNQSGWTFCTNCGNPLAPSGAVGWATSSSPSPPPSVPAQPPPAYPGYPAYPTYPAYPGVPPYGYGPPPWEVERQKQIRHTKSGVLLLLIGALVSWLPYVGFIGSFCTLIGAILVILGRKAFGHD